MRSPISINLPPWTMISGKSVLGKGEAVIPRSPPRRLYAGKDSSGALLHGTHFPDSASPRSAGIVRPISRLQVVEQLRLRRAGRRGFVVAPHHSQRQAHQDRFDAPAGLEPERGAAVIEQVELDIPAAADELPEALGFAVRLAHTLLNDRDVGGEEMIPGVAHKRKHFTEPVGEVVEEDAAHPASFTPVREIEIFVAPFFEPRVIGDGVALANLLPGTVEVDHVLATRVIGRQIGPPAEPRRASLARAFADVTKIRMHRRHMRVARVNNQ